MHFQDFTTKAQRRKDQDNNTNVLASLRCRGNIILRPGHPFSFLSLIFLLILSYSCHKDHSPEISALKNGTVQIDFLHSVNGNALVFDSLEYVTSLGNQYMVNDLQYFVSGLSFHQSGGTWVYIRDSSGIHYVDARIASSCQWQITQQLPTGNYDSIGFIFGLDEADNRSGRFVNPPERDMFWPEMLGGGYHYMKMNLKWKNQAMQETMPFMFHLGIGQMYSGTTADPDSIIGFIQNYFPVKLPVSTTISANHSSVIGVEMNVAGWFDGQNAFDFSLYPMGIMQNQSGMYRAALNGRSVFSFQPIVYK